MNRTEISKIALLISAVILLSMAVAVSRDYQDSWVLEGLEIPFVFFVAAFLLAFFSEKRASMMVALAVFGKAVFALIPNLKYVWFSGRAIDQHIQFALANNVLNEGHVVPEGVATAFYDSTPALHLSFASVSIVTGIPLLEVFKLLPIFWSCLYPLLTYCLVKKLEFSKEHPALGSALFASAIFVSALPLSAALTYVVTGSMFGILLSVFVLLQVVRLFRNPNRADWLLLVIFSCTLVIGHSFSALYLALLIVAIGVLLKFPFFRVKSYLTISTVALILLLNMVWLAFRAKSTLEVVVDEITNMGIFLGVYPKRGVIPVRFFELTSVNFLESLKAILVFNGADLFLLLLTVVAVILIARNRSWSNTIKFLSLLNLLLLPLMAFGILSGIGSFYWVRIVRIASISYAIFFGLLVANVNRKRIRSAATAFLLVAVIILAVIQVYPFQPLIGPANTISAELPADEPIVYVVSVNSIYQRKMVMFAEDNVNGLIACDAVTRNQLIGLTNISYAKNVLWFYPFSRMLDKNITERVYDYFLIHLPGKSGAFEEQAEIRTRSLILEAIDTSTVVYTNGESFVLIGTRRPSS